MKWSVMWWYQASESETSMFGARACERLGDFFFVGGSIKHGGGRDSA